MMIIKLLPLILLAEAASGQMLDFETLTNMKMRLAEDDHRLVRLSTLSEETTELQDDVCPIAIPHVYEALESGDIAHAGLAAEVLRLCTTDNPRNRATIGKTGYVHIGLNSLLNDGIAIYHDEHKSTKEKREATHAVAKGAEAVWILSYNHDYNADMFADAGLIYSLMSVLKFCLVNFEDEESICSDAVMWSLAALQNLAATYCESMSGRCEWKWNGNDLVINPEHPAKNDKALARRATIIAQVKAQNMTDLLTHFVCQGPVHKPNSDTHPWPGKSEDPVAHGHIPTIIPWAAAGFIKNLALDPTLREAWHHNDEMFHCLCDMAWSPDWLEESKANAALYNLGWEEECPAIHDGCVDYPNWEEENDESTCQEYEEENYCAEYGHLTDEEGTPANEACCICGGGESNEHEEL
jgi:hypothetical protein